MEGGSPVAPAATAIEDRNTGFSWPNVVVKGGGGHGGLGVGAAASNVTVVTTPDQVEVASGGASVLDMNVSQHVEVSFEVVPGPSRVAGRKRKCTIVFDGICVSDVSSSVSSGDRYSYKSVSSDASSGEAEVHKFNFQSYEKNAEEKLWKDGIGAYMRPDGSYYCNFHADKNIPRDGLQEGLVEHSKKVKPRNLRDKANHAAQVKVLEYFE